MLHFSLRPFLLLSICLWLAGCKKDSNSLPTGDLFVTVLLQGNPVEGIRLTSDPAGVDATTGKSGSVILKGVAAGRYQLSAEDARFGATSVPVTVKSGDLTEVVIELRVDDAAYPQLSELAPDQNASYSTGEGIFFRVKVTDRKDQPGQLSVTWSSDRDGLLATLTPDASGQASFTTAKLSPGTHLITIRATDSDQLVSKRELTINVVSPSSDFLLSEPVQSAAGVRLSWSPVSAAGFRGYRILRSQSPAGPFDVVAVIVNSTQASFVDAAVLYGREFSYQIALMTAGAPDQFSQTRSIRVEGPGVSVGGDLAAILPDGTRRLLYGLNRASGELLAIDTDSRQIAKRITVGRRLDGITLAPDGSTLYAYAVGSRELVRVNLDGFTLRAPITLAAAGDGARETLSQVFALAGGLIASVEMGATGRVGLYDGSTGAFVATVSAPGLTQAAVGANGTDLYASIYPAAATAGQLARFRLEGRSLVLADQSATATVDREAIPCVSRDGNFVFWGPTKYSVSNLKQAIGSIGENVRACSPNVGLVVGERQIWNATRFGIEDYFPVEASAVSFVDGGKTIAAYDVTSGKVYFVPAP